MSVSSIEAQDGSAASSSPPTSDDGSVATRKPTGWTTFQAPPPRESQYTAKTFKGIVLREILPGEYVRIRGEMLPDRPADSSFLNLPYPIEHTNRTISEYAKRLCAYVNNLQTSGLHRMNGHDDQALLQALEAHFKTISKYDDLEFCEIPNGLGFVVIAWSSNLQEDWSPDSASEKVVADLLRWHHKVGEKELEEKRKQRKTPLDELRANEVLLGEDVVGGKARSAKSLQTLTSRVEGLRLQIPKQ